LLDHQNN